MKLGEVIQINPESVGRNYPFEEIEYVDISSVGTGFISDTKRLKTVDAPSRAKRIVKHQDTILATVRPNLRAFSFIKNPSENTVVSTGFAVLRANEQINPRFLYYLISNQSFTDYLTANAKGAAYPAIDTETIIRAEIDLPIRRNQDRITSILSAYDDLIENNTRQIDILEETAQRIYEEWFVKIRFPGYEQTKLVESEMGHIPESWTIAKVGEISKVKSGYAFKSKDWQTFGNRVVKIKNVDNNQVNTMDCECVSDKVADNALNFLLKPHDLLIAMTGATIGKIGLMPRTKYKCYLNQRVGIFKPIKEPRLSFFLFTLFNREETQKQIVNLALGAAQPNISPSQIESIKFVLPQKSLLNRFLEITELIFNQRLVLMNRIENLRETRDLLLPKLISGEVDVSHFPEPEII